jgi:peptidoglycan/xylan/chitin deacetylase (PgdA/CDA1 family)
MSDAGEKVNNDCTIIIFQMGDSMKAIPVLMYHQVCEDGTFEPSEFIVSASTFRRQLQYMADHGFTTPHIADILGRKNGIGDKPVILTFDDGYLNNYQVAFPLLQQFGFSALISLVADPALRTNAWDASKGIPSAELMEPCHIREMAEYGIEFASHTYRHRSLPHLSEEELTTELTKSKEVIEDILGKRVEALVYPYGDVDKRVKKAVRQTGYDCAFATHSGPLDFYSDLYEIRRMLIEDNADPVYMHWMLSGGKKAFMWGVGMTKKLFGKHNKFQSELTYDRRS